MHAEISLTADMRSPRAARHFVAVTLESWGLDHVVDVVTLLTSELATNAIIHGGTEFELALHTTDDVLRVDVGDRSSRRLTQRELDTSQVGGRGLFLVEAMSRACGVELHNGGKRVWFELSLVDHAADDETGASHGTKDATDGSHRRAPRDRASLRSHGHDDGRWSFAPGRSFTSPTHAVAHSTGHHVLDHVDGDDHRQSSERRPGHRG